MQNPLSKLKVKDLQSKLPPKKRSNTIIGDTGYGVCIKNIFENNPHKGLELLFTKYYNPLCNHAARMVSSTQVAEDLVSEVFLSLLRTKAYLNITSSYKSYLFRAVSNECYTHSCSANGRLDSLGVYEENMIPCDNLLPDAEIHFNHLVVRVNEVIDQLPTKCQRAFVLSRFDEMKYLEIAKELNISPKTVEVHISKALKRLRMALNDEWYSPVYDKI
jgi:RNA polymerase sigma-70 factor (family 1)